MAVVQRHVGFANSECVQRTRQCVWVSLSTRCFRFVNILKWRASLTCRGRAISALRQEDLLCDIRDGVAPRSRRSAPSTAVLGGGCKGGLIMLASPCMSCSALTAIAALCAWGMEHMDTGEVLCTSFVSVSVSVSVPVSESESVSVSVSVCAKRSRWRLGTLKTPPQLAPNLALACYASA